MIESDSDFSNKFNDNDDEPIKKTTTSKPKISSSSQSKPPKTAKISKKSAKSKSAQKASKCKIENKDPKKSSKSKKPKSNKSNNSDSESDSDSEDNENQDNNDDPMCSSEASYTEIGIPIKNQKTGKNKTKKETSKSKKEATKKSTTKKNKEPTKKGKSSQKSKKNNENKENINKNKENLDKNINSSITSSTNKEKEKKSNLNTTNDNLKEDDEKEISFDQDKELDDLEAQRGTKLECTAVEEIIDPNYFIEPLNVYDKFHLAKIDDTNPIDIYNKYFTSEFIKYICEQTNNYAIENNLSKDKPVTEEDISNYLFILIYVSVIKMPQIDMLWTKSEYYTTIVPKIMSLYKFKKITQYFHVGAVGGTDPMSKLNLIISYFNEKWKENYYYGQMSTIDECMAAFKGKTRFRQYIKSKHKKRGIKFFAQSNSLTGYLYSVIPYTGKEMEYDRTIGCGPSILKTFVLETLDRYKKNGQEEIDIHFTYDNYFSTVDMFDYFNQLGLYFTCTINAKRSCFPDNIKTAKCAKGGVRSFVVGDNEYRYLLYNQKGKVAYLASNAFTAYNTTYINKMRKKKIKPEIVYIYNVTKAGVDKIDSTTNQYKSQRRTKKWWKAAFFYLYDITLYNASVVYFENTGKEENSKVLFFRRKLYEMHFSQYLRLKEVNQSMKLHLPKRTEQFRECEQCKKNKGDKRQHVCRTRYICTGCNARLCVDCFVNFHK